MNVARFGNVIESNGSIRQTFRNQIARGHALMVTHNEATRFLVTVDGVTLLIIQRALVGRPGDTFVLDMGEPRKIIDLARAVDPTLRIEITGLRPGEKMFEELSYEPDRVDPTENPKIFAVRDRSMIDPAELLQRVAALVDDARLGATNAGSLVESLRGFDFAIQ